MRQIYKLAALCLSATLFACGGGGAPSKTATPQALIETITTTETYTHQAVTFIADGISANKSSSTLTYSWEFGDGATANTATASHSYATAGEYTVRLLVSEGDSDKAVQTRTIIVTAAPDNVPPRLSISANKTYPNRALNFYGSAVNPDNLAITYSWNFGDGQTSTGDAVSHVYTAAGTYTVTLLATNSNGHSAPMATSTIEVLAPNLAPAALNTFAPDCVGLNCAATDASHYSGEGIGIWRYTNTQTSAAVININIDDVPKGKEVTLVYSNGKKSSTKTTAQFTQTAGRQNTYSAEARMALENQRIAQEVAARKQNRKSQAQSFVQKRIYQAAPPTPSVGSSRVWKDTFSGTVINYTLKAEHVCALPDGRNAVFWLDSNAGISNQDMEDLHRITCGNEGFYTRLTGLLGAPWGSASADDPDLIQETPEALQDFNIVMIKPPAGTEWGGYFDGENAMVTGQGNRALAIMINTNSFKAKPDYVKSTLIHETVHLINFYQNSVVNGKYHDMWIEETSAMMGQDLVVPRYLNGYNDIASIRVPGYIEIGGGLNYIDWQYLKEVSYNIAGSFGAFINRRFGSSVFSQINGPCLNTADTSSYGCFDALLKAHGSRGFEDEFARFGASIYAGLQAKNLPFGYGYPAIQTATATLQPIDISRKIKYRPAKSATTGAMEATSHRYEVFTQDSSQNQFSKQGVVVPPLSDLIVVIQ